MEETSILMLTSQKNVHHVPDINGEKSILQSKFVSIFTSLKYLVRHLLIEASKNKCSPCSRY